MRKMPLVSVIIPTYNRLEYICEAIESVLAQTYKNYEIIIVDDGSPADVKQNLESYMDKIKYIYQENKGLGPARNTGIRNAKGKYLAFLDDDDLFEPRKLEIQVQILERNPEIRFVYSGAYYFDTENNTNTTLILPHERDKPSSEFAKVYFLNHDIPISALLVRHKSMEDIGIFDGRFYGNEDVYMWLRLSLQWEGRCSGYPSTRIRLHPTRMSQDRVTMYESLIRALEEILRMYPDLEKSLGADADRKISNLHYLSGHEYLKRKKITKARKEFILCIKSAREVNYKTCLYLLAVSLGRIPAIAILKSFSVAKKILRILEDVLRKDIRYVTFVSGTITWKECLIILISLFLSKDIARGKDIKEYEEGFAKYLGVKYAFSFGGGRMALYSILKAMRIQEGDEVILSGYTCVVVPNAVIYCGAKPIYVDIDPHTLNMDIRKIEEKITPRTRLVIIQHTFGSFCNMDDIKKIARKYDLKLVEDCAHALGAEYDGKKVGTFGDAAFFTTEQSKIISTGMGGVAITNDEEIAVKLREIQTRSEFHKEKVIKRIALQIVLYNIFYHPLMYLIGKYVLFILNKLNFFIRSTTVEEMEGKRPERYPVRLSNIQAKVGLSQLKRIDSNLGHRRKIAMLYRRLLTKFNYEIPESNDKSYNPSYIRYWFLLKDREKWKRILQSSKVEIGEWFNCPIHPKGTALENVFYEKGSCPKAEYVTHRNVNLPTHPKINLKNVERFEAQLKEISLGKEG